MSGDRRTGSDGNTCLIIPVEEFWDRKVDWYTQMWWNERHTDDQYVNNMVHYGFDESSIRNNMYEE